VTKTAAAAGSARNTRRVLAPLALVGFGIARLLPANPEPQTTLIQPSAEKALDTNHPFNSPPG
jgi:hypothetical protein